MISIIDFFLEIRLSKDINPVKQTLEKDLRTGLHI